MAVSTWSEIIEAITPYVVKVLTPRGTGTGFLVAHASGGHACGIATAAHVVAGAHYWEEPIRIHHFSSGETVLLRQTDRAILPVEKLDTAAIVFAPGKIPFPADPLPLIPEKKFLKVGHEVGWLGFPAVSANNLCFFSGRASCLVQDERAYLVDGVAINGVSGGPAFHLPTDVPFRVIGVVSAYIPNRATGEALPGLCIIRDVQQFQVMVHTFKSLAEAKEKEPVPAQAPPAPPEKEEPDS